MLADRLQFQNQELFLPSVFQSLSRFQLLMDDWILDSARSVSFFWEGAAEWTASGLENRGTTRRRGSIPPPSFDHQRRNSDARSR